VGDQLVLLTATCRSCGGVTEIGYVQGRARVAVTGFRCARCGAEQDSRPPFTDSPALDAGSRKGPRRSPRSKSLTTHSSRV